MEKDENIKGLQPVTPDAEPKKLRRKRKASPMDSPEESSKGGQAEKGELIEGAFGAAQDASIAGPIAGNKRRKRKKSKRKLYEIDNSELPLGIPPVQAFLPDWSGSAPERQLSEQQSEAPDALQQHPETQKKKRRRSHSKKVHKGDSKSFEEIFTAVMSALESNSSPMTKQDLLLASEAPQTEFEAAIRIMLNEGRIFTSRKQKLGLPEQLGFVSGRIQATSRGFAFLLPDDGTEDVFIPQSALKTALNGDLVVVRLLESFGNSREGEVTFIRERANTRLVGTMRKYGGNCYVDPDNRKLGTSFLVKNAKASGAKDGHKVLCSLLYDQGAPYAKIEEILGFPDESGTDVLSIIKSHDIPEEFPKHVLQSARSIPQEVSADDIARREDLRKLMLFTIDGAHSKDFDDAVSCEKLGNNNYLLGVHIADVAHYVKEGATLDKEALRRGTSVYFIDRVIPMLPETLSNGICSLNPGVDRLALSCFVEIDERGKVIGHRLSETVINSKQRFIYEDVSALIDGDSSMRRKYKKFAPTLDMMSELAALLREQRFKRGSIDFDIPEAQIEVDPDGKPVKIALRERGVADKLIEEFMLCCNETIAAHMAYLDCPMIYRVHETPDSEKIEELNAFLGGFGLGIRGMREKLRPKALQTVLAKASGRAEEAVISRVVLRSLKKARYSEQNLGHFGLAAEYYCHFTSPIRRYPDLMAHRIIKEMLRGQLNDKRQESLKQRLVQIADQSSDRERSAMEAEREVDDLKKCEYMSGFVGEIFDGIISGVTNFGMFVELPNTCEGMVRLSDMTDDHYEYHEKEYRLVGRHTRMVYRLGDPVSVKVTAADISSRRVDFELIPDVQPTGRRPRKRKI